MLSPIRLALSGALLLSSSVFHTATAQPLPTTQTPAPLQQNQIPIQVESKIVKEELLLQIDLHKGDIIQTLNKIAIQGNLQVIVTVDAKTILRDLALKDVSPEMAIEEVAKAGGLSSEFKDGVWFISAAKAAPNAVPAPELISSMAFADVPVTQLLSLIAKQFDVPIAIAPDVAGQLRFLRLQNKTPRQAVESIAKAADLKIQENDGVLILAKADTK
ncbi:hypothetical protein EON83_16315 [bacterium]|nr:MAG: hypothetical protein EON83_16315 [bacterium]